MSLIITQGYGGEYDSNQPLIGNIQWYVNRIPNEFRLKVVNIAFFSKIIKVTNVSFNIKTIPLEFTIKPYSNEFTSKVITNSNSLIVV